MEVIYDTNIVFQQEHANGIYAGIDTYEPIEVILLDYVRLLELSYPFCPLSIIYSEQ
jgi:hypothetical protein